MTETGEIVETTAGRLRGERTGTAGDAVAVFRGIPYAEAPTGERRWAPPESRRPWTGVLDATGFGPAAWQPVGGPLDHLVPGMGAERLGDDCLTLNVWTPAADAGRRPVMVWLHGGAFTIGAGSLEVYDGARLAAHEDLVVVTCNYRLGALGFLLVDHAGATPNVGLLDQVAALAWVRDNIAAFGGDPGNVTVFGESAGGGSVLSLLAMPAARGLFHKAIVQSGATDLVLSRDKALAVTDTFARLAGVSPHDLSALRALPVETLLDAQAGAAGALLGEVGMMPFHPVADGVVLPDTWHGAAAAGASAGVPVVIGTTRDEMRLFASFDPSLASLDERGLHRRLATLPDPEALVAAYRADEPDLSPAELWQGVQTDTAMWLPALRWAAAHGAHAPVWMYRFDWPAAPAGMGAPHAVDIPFPFTNLDRAGWDRFVADPDDARALARTVQRLWAAFARTGHPASAGLEWPRFDPDERATLLLGRDVHVERDPRGAVRRLWESSTRDPTPAGEGSSARAGLV